MNKKLMVKVCGMRNPANILQIARLLPDFLGFIFYPDSKRYVGEIIPAIEPIPDNIITTGVFVNESFENIIRLTKLNNLKAIQLHGNETPEFCDNVKKENLILLKAFHISNGFNFGILDTYSEYCDYFIFDTETNQYGGSGIKFNWNILQNYKGKTPFFLSGGIGLPDAEAIQKLKHDKLAGIDINSRFEISPALKDVEKVKTFINKIRP